MSDDEASGLGCVALVTLGGVLWLCWENSPVSWYFLAAATSSLIATNLYDQARTKREASNSFKARVAEAAADDFAFFLSCLTIGIGLVFLLQVILRACTFVGPESLAAFEQGAWNFLLAFKLVIASPAVLLGIVAGSLTCGILLKTWLPAVMAGRLRKWAGGSATILASALMFSFVTGEAAETRYPETTEGLRADIVERLDKVAAARREAVAYRWAQTIIQRKLADAEWRTAAVDLALRVRAECNKTDGLANAARDELSGYFGAKTFENCDQAEIETRALQEILPKPSDGFVSNLDYPIELRDVWLPEPEASLVRRDGEFFDNELSLHYDLKEKFLSLAQLAALRAKVDNMSADADAARTAMRGGLLKIVTGWLNEQLPIPGLADRIVDTLRDATLSQLAKDGDRLVRDRLAALRAAPSHRASHGPELYPDLPVSKFASLDVLQADVRADAARAIVAKQLPERQRFQEIFQTTGNIRAFQIKVKKEVYQAQQRRITNDATIPVHPDFKPDPPRPRR